MPESIGHGSTHTDRLRHHAQRVHQARAQVDAAAVAAAAARYAPGEDHNSTSAPPGAGNGDHNGNN